MKITALTPIRHGAKDIREGESFDADKASAEALIAQGAAVAVAAAAAVAAAKADAGAKPSATESAKA